MNPQSFGLTVRENDYIYEARAVSTKYTGFHFNLIVGTISPFPPSAIFFVFSTVSTHYHTNRVKQILVYSMSFEE